MNNQPGESASAPDNDLGSAVEALRGTLRGEVLVAGDEGYDDARAVWNAMIDRRPAVIVRCRGVADVVDAVAFARDQGLPVSIRGGAHNVAGHAVCEGGLMIDLSLMRSVRVDPRARRVWVQGGATWGDVDRETQLFGLATPGGLISDTGVGGLTLSGGIGWLRSRYGLSIDNMLSAEVVTADGRLVRASEEENPDLFWALRGGGGNFGVVTGFEFALHAIGPKVMFCAPIYPIEAGAEPIRFWRDFMHSQADDAGSLIEFSTVPEDPEFPRESWGRRVFTIAAVFAGDAGEGEKRLQPLRGLADLVADFSGQMNYCDVQSLFDAQTPFGRHRCYWKSIYLNALSDDIIDVLLQGNTAPPSPNTLSSIWKFGGATARVPAAATAFGDRSMPYMFSVDSVWSAPEDDETNLAWTRDFWQRLQPHSHHGRMYLNFPGLGEDADILLQKTFGSNYARLATIKKKYDPQNVFRFNQNINPASQ
ncbi:MAG TPA: FAD-binding oxidoreductase [Gammaproteobacteria bacterium]|nr:FAD-binding oxidoreductase [Gammaproteobacteria bacterium]